MGTHEFQSLNQEARDAWDANADHWDSVIGKGNAFQTQLIWPAQERLLGLRPDELVLEVACGNGQFARRMAQADARVVASDVSPRMIEHAKARTTENTDRIEYRLIDATDADALLALGERRFDAAVCTMAIMDIASIEPLFSAMAKVLKPTGRFVFSVTHPCFNSPSNPMVVEESTTDDGELVYEYSIKVSKYITPEARKGIAVRGQPKVDYYFERPLSILLNACFGAGFIMDGFEEPTFLESMNTGRPRWGNTTEIPPILAVRMRLNSA